MYYWNREPVAGRLVTIVVGAPPEGQHPWYAPYVGVARHAVELTLPTGKMVYLDNEDGEGFRAATTVPGQALPSHRTMPCARIVAEDAPPPAVPPAVGAVIPQPYPAHMAGVTPAEMNAHLRATYGGVGGGDDLAAANTRIADLEAQLAELTALVKTGPTKAEAKKPAAEPVPA